MPSLFANRLAVFVILSAIATPVAAETHIVEMRNADPDNADVVNVFTPPVLRIAPGDSVRFKVIDPGHNSASKKGMIPDGATPWNGKIDEEIEVTFTIDGTYGYICLPHYEMGMVGLILVGDHTQNLAEAKKVRHRSRAKSAFRALFAIVDDMK